MAVKKSKEKKDKEKTSEKSDVGKNEFVAVHKILTVPQIPTNYYSTIAYADLKESFLRVSAFFEAVIL